MTVLTTELPVDPDPLAHRNPACNIDITVTPFWMYGKRQQRLLKQDLNTLPRNLFCRRGAGSFLHCLIAWL
jgi:hypothetical protein